MHSKCVFARVGDCTSSVIDPEHGERNDSLLVTLLDSANRSMKWDINITKNHARVSIILVSSDEGLHRAFLDNRATFAILRVFCWSFEVIRIYPECKDRCDFFRSIAKWYVQNRSMSCWFISLKKAFYDWREKSILNLLLVNDKFKWNIGADSQIHV